MVSMLHLLLMLRLLEVHSLQLLLGFQDQEVILEILQNHQVKLMLKQDRKNKLSISEWIQSTKEFSPRLIPQPL